MSENSEINQVENRSIVSNKVENSLERVLDQQQHQDLVGIKNSELTSNKLTKSNHVIITNTTENNMDDCIDLLDGGLLNGDDQSTLNHLADKYDTNDTTQRKNDDTIDTSNVGQQQDDGKIINKNQILYLFLYYIENSHSKLWNFDSVEYLSWDVTLYLFTKQRTKFTLFVFVFPETLEMISRKLDSP